VKSTAIHRTAAGKLVGSIGIVAAAAAVAGLGTFGTFTDSTDAMAAGIDNGTVSIDLAQAAQSIVLPQADGGWAPGDYTRFPIDLVNNGTSALSSVTLDVTATESSLLDTNTVDGLQLLIENCSQAWNAGPDYTCAGTTTEYYSGPVVMRGALEGAASLAAGGVDHLLVTANLPAEAGNEFQDATTVLTGMFTGVQRAGITR
jgi:hypothetical protein